MCDSTKFSPPATKKHMLPGGAMPFLIFQNEGSVKSEPTVNLRRTFIVVLRH